MINIDRRIIIGSCITLSGSVLYVFMGLLSKKVGAHLLINQIIFLQSLAGLICASFFIKMKRYSYRQLFRKHEAIYFVRTAVSLGSIYALITGLHYISVFNALIIMNCTPFVIPVLRRVFFHKKIHPFIFPAVLIAFVGIMLILAPDRHIMEASVVIVVISMLCLAFSLLLLEKSKRTDPNLTIFYYFFYSTLVSSLILLFKQQALATSFYYLPSATVLGVLFFFIQLSVIFAAQYISSQLMSVLFYSEIIIALGVSMLFENLQLSQSLAIGTVLVLIGGLAVIIIENRVNLAEKANT